MRILCDRCKKQNVEFELFGICSDYVPLDTAIQVVIKLGKGQE